MTLEEQFALPYALGVAMEYEPEKFTFGTDFSIRFDGLMISNDVWKKIPVEKRDRWVGVLSDHAAELYDEVARELRSARGEGDDDDE